MTGADIFIQNCKDIIEEKVYAEHFVPELMVSEPMSDRDIAIIESETGIAPKWDIKIYKPTGSMLYGYYEYAYHKTITR